MRLLGTRLKRLAARETTLINFKNLSRAVLVATAVAFGLTLLGLMTAPASGAQGIDSGIIVNKVVEPLGAGDPGEFVITVTSSATGPEVITDVIDGTVWFREFIAGAEETFTISETAAAGTNAADYVTTIECSVNGGLPNLIRAPLADSPSLSITVPSTQLAVCTITNTNINPPRPRLTIIKATVPASDPQDFEFEITRPSPDSVITPTLDTDLDNTPPVRSNNTTVIGEPGSWSFQEFPTTGWDFGGVSCVDQGGNTFNTSSRDGNEAHRDVALAYGDDITCTFTNIKQTGTLTIAKVTLPAGDPAQFNFFIDGTVYGPITGGQRTDPIVVPVGELTIFEDAPSGWFPTDFACELEGGGAVTHNQDAGDPDEGTVTIPPGGDVTCTFTNTKLGSITIEKQTLPAGDGTDFGFTYNGVSIGSAEDDETIVVPALLPGVHTIAETTIDGWALTDISCDDDNSSGDASTGVATINLEAGENVKCTFTNTKLATVTVSKVTAPDTGVDQDFLITLATAGGSRDGTINAAGTVKEYANVQPGSYTLLEFSREGWTTTGVACTAGARTLSSNSGVLEDIEVNAGADIACTVTNTKNGSITIEKQTLPEGDPAAFGFVIDGIGYGPVGDGEQAGPVSVAPGNVVIDEDELPGWVATEVACARADGTAVDSTQDAADPSKATVTIAPGEDVTCTYTNTKLATVTIAKETLPDGDDTEFTFTGTGGGDELTALIADGGSETVMLAPNIEYQVSEAIPEGWTLTDLTCSADGTSVITTLAPVATFTPEPGDVITCTFTNTKDGSITIVKDSNRPGSSSTFDFTGDITANLATGATSTAAVAPGVYTVTESAPPSGGWKLTALSCNDANSSGDVTFATATFTVEPGEDVTCTFFNTFTATPGISTLQPDPDAQTELILKVIRSLDDPPPAAATPPATAAAAAPAPAPATADRPLAVTGASSSLLAMFGMAAIGSGAYVHGARRLRRRNT